MLHAHTNVETRAGAGWLELAVKASPNFSLQPHGVVSLSPYRVNTRNVNVKHFNRHTGLMFYLYSFALRWLCVCLPLPLTLIAHSSVFLSLFLFLPHTPLFWFRNKTHRRLDNDIEPDRRRGAEQALNGHHLSRHQHAADGEYDFHAYRQRAM